MRTLMLGTALALAAGCVSKSKYAELEDMYDEALQERDQAQADRERAIDEYKDLQARMEKRVAAFGEVYRELMKVHEKGLAKISIEDGRAVLQLDSDVLFASGSAELTDEGEETVAEIARILAEETTAEFMIEGHTDSDPIDSDRYPDNWHLGAARAITVAQAMAGAGMPGDRLAAASYGDTMPVAANDTATHKALNRRIEIVLVPELSDLLPYRRIVSEMKKGRRGGGGDGG